MFIYEDKESAFAGKINDKIDELTKDGKSIVEINVLSTKRAVIQYDEKYIIIRRLFPTSTDKLYNKAP